MRLLSKNPRIMGEKVHVAEMLAKMKKSDGYNTFEISFMEDIVSKFKTGIFKDGHDFSAKQLEVFYKIWDKMERYKNMRETIIVAEPNPYEKYLT